MTRLQQQYPMSRPDGSPVPPPPRRRWWGCLPVAIVLVLLLVLALLLLAGNAARQREQSAPTTAVPGPTTPAPTSPVPDSEAVASSCTKQEGLIVRECAVISPPDVAAGERLPVVVLLPGLGDSPMGVRTAGDWANAVVEHRFVLVTPAGLFASWNAGACCGIANGTGIDDLGYLATLVAELKQRPDVDPGRVFMAGFSNGGMMVYRYLCLAADSIRAAASVSGPRMIDCAPNRSIPMLHVHGTADETVPYRGGQGLLAAVLGVSFPPVPTMAADFAADDGCTGAPSERTEGAITTEEWTGCGGDARVELVTLQGWTHIWPMNDDVNATRLVLEFFGLA